MNRASRTSISCALTVLVLLGSKGLAADATVPAQAHSGKVRILVLTGNEYPGHKWQETAPLIAKFLAVDPRMSTEVNADPAFLASPELSRYDAIVLNYLNWKCPDPGEPAREGLKKFVESGKGLVIVHNACAAFGEWPEFKKIAGRAWNPNRVHGHDPQGTFIVEVTSADHPITHGMKSFETIDELYTCLLTDGPPVEVLAKAKSKVEDKDHPMALINRYGQGRVFLCVLGHDTAALSVDAVQQLYRRGTAWAAGLPPVGE
jgi:uncharacterized protein